MNDPIAISPPLPRDYGKATKPMAWPETDRLLTDSRVYWIATTRPDGRPHVVPSDGIWLDGALYFGGARQTVHMRNARATGHARSARVGVDQVPRERNPVRLRFERRLVARGGDTLGEGLIG